MRDKLIFSSERVLHKDYDRKFSVEKISGIGSQGVWRQDELIGGKPPVVKWIWLCYTTRIPAESTVAPLVVCIFPINLLHSNHQFRNN
jgi:hypothetical protein